MTGRGGAAADRQEAAGSSNGQVAAGDDLQKSLTSCTVFYGSESLLLVT